MAATSLVEQLKGLSVPQSTIYQEEKRVVSLLFDPKEAAHKDRNTFYEIGCNGLLELIALNEGFQFYGNSLFSLSSKDFERAVQSKEVNQNLDQTIEKFLLEVSPYLLLQSTAKALEWLVNRFQIHQYNQDAVMSLILPYHETKIFTRFIQLMDISSTSNRWNWLKPIKKSGITLSREVLYNQCLSNPSTLKFISKMTLKYVNEFGDRASQLKTVYMFFYSTAVGTMNMVKHMREAVLNALLPTLLKALESKIVEFRSSAYAILGFLSIKATIKKDTINEIICKILTCEFDLSYDMVTVINLFFLHQKHLKKMSDKILYNMSVDTFNDLCKHLKTFVEKKKNIKAFILSFLSCVLSVIQKNSEEFRRFSKFPEILFDEINFKNEQPVEIIRCFLDSYGFYESSQMNNDDDESDVEIIPNDDDFDGKIIYWYSNVLKNLENKYPEEFDKVLKDQFKCKSPKRQKQILKILSFKPEVAHTIHGTYLFESLNHIDPHLRIDAIKYMEKHFNVLKLESIDFVKESLIARLNDDNSEVVEAALDIPTSCLNEVFSELDISNIFKIIVSNNSPQWTNTIKRAICKFCSLDMLPVSQEVILSIIPFLFPKNENEMKITSAIIHSNWGNKFKLTKNLNAHLSKDHKSMTKKAFDAIFIEQVMDFSGLLDISKIDKNNTTEICLYMLLKSACLNGASNQCNDVLNLLFESVEYREIISSSKLGNEFCSDLMPIFLKKSKENKILFTIMEYIFTKIIENLNVNFISKPWCNICSSSETILVKSLYECFLTCCYIPDYADKYTVLLQKLFDKLFDSCKEKVEFVANIAYGHILYAKDPKDVVGPELQLRSLKLLNNLIAIYDDTDWVYESDVIMCMILFNLNHPITVLRQSTVETISLLLRKNPDNRKIYVQLMQELITHKEELILDHEQICHVMHSILIVDTPSPKAKIFRKNCLAKFKTILNENTPPHVVSALLHILCNVNSTYAFTQIVPYLKTFPMKDGIKFDMYQSKVIKNIYSRIDKDTVATFSDINIWELIEAALKQFSECILEENLTYTIPSILVMKQIYEEIFNNIPKERSKNLIHLIASAGTFSNNSKISSMASKVMKRIHLCFEDIKPVLNGMLNAVDPDTNVPKKKKTSVQMLSYKLTETNEWRLGVTLLEYVQNKRKMSVDSSFVSLLFQILNKCLRFEEQSYVEYTKQLILSSLWYYCKKFVDDTNEEEMNNLKSAFDIELVVQCIRGTQNPQTHHHALIVLSHAAYMLPERVLHHTMEIFTFMGSSVLRHDDAYSFQIIIKIIETLIPILVKLDKKVDECTNQELQQLQARVVPVLRIFADVVLHVPEHRRLPLYKKLIETLRPDEFLWVFLALLLETHVAHFNQGKQNDKRQNRSLFDQELPASRLDFGQDLLLEFSPEICLQTLVKLMDYLQTLPLQKDENSVIDDINPSEIFSVNGHSALQLRHYKYTIITFMNNCLASSRFIQHSSQAEDMRIMEESFKSYITNILTFIESITKVSLDNTMKYWRVMSHHSYNLLNHTNNLLTPPMFVFVISGLLKHNIQTVRRKSMEILNSKLQLSSEMFSDEHAKLLYTLLPALLDIVKTIDDKDETLSETVTQELELNQQTALLSLKLLVRLLGNIDPEPFKPVLETIIEYTCSGNLCGNVMASVVLCLAELCSNLNVHVLGSLPRLIPALLKVLKKQRKAETPELVLLSTVTAISKIVESLPLFLSPYLQKILYEYSVLFSKWEKENQECIKVSAIFSKLSNIRNKIANSIPPRVLIPVASETHNLLLNKEYFDEIGSVFSLLGESFKNLTTLDFNALREELKLLFLTALKFRYTAAEKNIDVDIESTEGEIINAFVSLVLKLPETSFKPLYVDIYDWAVTFNKEKNKDKFITFYRLSSALAENIKGIFVMFSEYFMKNAAELLDAYNNRKTEDSNIDSHGKCDQLITSIIKTFQLVFLYDSQKFFNKDRFETVMQPIVDQLENTLGGIYKLKSRATEYLIPCIAQFAVAVSDDLLWKHLNYQILLKTRHNDAEIRLIALECLVAVATQLGNQWLPLLPESINFLSELLEDGDQRIETSTKNAIRTLEQILEEPLEEYFKR